MGKRSKITDKDDINDAIYGRTQALLDGLTADLPEHIDVTASILFAVLRAVMKNTGADRGDMEELLEQLMDGVEHSLDNAPPEVVNLLAIERPTGPVRLRAGSIAARRLLGLEPAGTA